MQRLLRRPVRVLLLCAPLLVCGVAVAWAQSGTLQLPEHRRAEPPKPPLPAPLTPVHQERLPHRLPVIAPRKEAPRHRPEAQHRPPPPPHKPAPPKKSVPVADPNKGTSTGLPLPRFAALRTDEVNLRTGPGTRYPIEWVYKRRYLPVEIEREFDVWRLVLMPDGTRGWVHQATLTGRRSFDVEAAEATLRARPDHGGAAVAILKQGVIGRIRSCAAGAAWCRVQVGSHGGYVRRNEIWGMLPNEVIAP